MRPAIFAQFNHVAVQSGFRLTPTEWKSVKVRWKPGYTSAQKSLDTPRSRHLKYRSNAVLRRAQKNVNRKKLRVNILSRMATGCQQPVLFLSHGAGPSFYIDSDVRLKGLDKTSNAATFLQNLAPYVGIQKPSAILVFSAHWVEKTCTVTSSAKPSLYYDYSGFPPETYKLQWPVPGAPDVAKKIVGLFAKHGVTCRENSSRGLDHGVFVPLKLVFPEADIPVLQVSLLDNLDIAEHCKLGEAIAAIRKENVLIVGSGFGTHDGFLDTEPAPWALKFQTLIHDIVTNEVYSPEQRKEKLISLANEECYQRAHTPPDHFLPTAMCMAVVGYKPGKILLSEFVRGSLMNDHYLFE